MRKFRSQHVVEKHKRIFWVKFVFFWIFLFILIYLISYLSKSEEVGIIDINIIGNEAVQDKDILEIINKNLEGNYLGLFSKSNVFLYPKSKIKTEISNSFLIIKELIISFNDFKSIDINIAERKPFALYCENTKMEFLEKEESSQENCYFMDDKGYVYTKAMNFSDNIYFKYYEETPDFNQNILGKTYLSKANKNQFEKINLFIRFLKDINIDVYRLTIKKDGDYELVFGNNSKLLFEGKQDFNVLLENLQAILIDLGDIGEKEFEYIDLRFNNKIFHKFKD